MMRMSKRKFRGLVAVAGIAGLGAGGVVQATAVAAVPDSPQRVMVRAEHPPTGSAAHRLGPLTGTTRVPIAVTLKSRDDAGLDAFATAVSDPHSADYRHFLTSAQYRQRFAPTSASVDAVRDYLSAQGLTVTGVSGNRQVVDAVGSPAQVQASFGTGLGQYRDDRTGQSFYANDSAVSVPSSLAGIVNSVSGLNSLPVAAPSAVRSTGTTPASGSGPAGGHAPADYRSIYGMTSLTGSYDGSGQTVGLFEFDGFQQSDITKYTQQFSLPTLTPKVVAVDGGVSSLGSGQLEVTLDIDAVAALAPKAAQLVYEAPNTDSAWTDEINKIASDNKVTVFSSSWLAGESCESSVISGSHTAIAQMVSQGVSVFSASGDWGGHGCDYNGDNSTITADYMASDPNVTGVGGTTLNNTTATPEAYTSETCWNTASTGNTRSGGGYSATYSTPSYQTSVNSNGHRSVPDVAMDADYNTGALSVYLGSSGWERVGGTSLASPMWAAYASLLDQKGGKPLGALNPTIYSIAGSSQYASTFHDVTSGNNDTYSAKTGYDLCTGWGSMKGDALATAILGGGTQPTNDFSVTVSPASGSVAPGKSVTATVSTTVTSGSAESVALSASGLPTGASATFSPTSVTAGNSASLSIATTTSTPAGTYPVTITGKSADATHTATYTLTVTGSGTGTVTVANPGDQSGTVGTPVTLNNSASGGTGSYTWSASGLPTGLSIASSSGQITGTPSAAGTYAVTVTATDGNGATGSAKFNWTINPKSGPATVTVSNPGTQSNYQGTRLSPPLQINATDSAGNPLRFTAAGLPAGLTISSTGLISGTFTAWGNYYATVTATDSTGARGSTSFYWFVFNSYGPRVSSAE